MEPVSPHQGRLHLIFYDLAPSGCSPQDQLNCTPRAREKQVNKANIWRVIVGLCFVVIIALVAMTIMEGQYLEAVAISSVGSAFAWFALGAGKIGS